VFQGKKVKAGMARGNGKDCEIGNKLFLSDTLIVKYLYAGSVYLIANRMGVCPFCLQSIKKDSI